MLHRDGDFEEWQLAEAARYYIPLYARSVTTTVFIPYKDVPSGKICYIKFEWLNEQWVYVDNNQARIVNKTK